VLPLLPPELGRPGFFRRLYLYILVNLRRIWLLALLVAAGCDRPLLAPEQASLSLIPREEGRIVIAEAVELEMYAYDNFTYNVEQIRVPEGKHLLEVHLEGQITITANPWAEVVQGSWLDGATFGPGGLLPPPAYGYPNLLATWVYYKPDNTDEYRLMYVSPRSARGTTQPLSFEYFTESAGEIIVYRNAAPLLPYQYLTLTGRHTVTVYATPLVESGELELTCTPDNFVRGRTRVDCIAAVDGDAEWQVTSWSFQSADGLEITPDGYTEKTWGGLMVRGGIVTVTAVGGGEPKTANVNVTVTARDWADRAPAYTFEKIANGADARLVLPDVITFSDDLGSSNWFRTETPASNPPDTFYDEVPSGPNEGLDYFNDEATLFFFGYYALNTAAMTRGSPFYEAQERGGGGVRVGGTNWCDQSIVTSTLPGVVEQHELYHNEVYRRTLTREFPAVMRRFEQLTALDNSVLYDAYDQAWSDLDDVARRESFAIHGEGGFPGLPVPRDSGGDCSLRNERGAVLRAVPEPASGN
jgi:hypothetical protein